MVSGARHRSLVMLLRGAGVVVIIVGLMLYVVEGGGGRQEVIQEDLYEDPRENFPEAVVINDTRGCPDYASYASYPQYGSPNALYLETVPL
jgi:hypothetical protein